MKSPYMVFVSIVARIVGGEFPEHYDSHTKNMVRIVLGTGTIVSIMVATQIHDPKIYGGKMSPLTNSEWSFIGIALIYFISIWGVARMRRKSIVKHILEVDDLDEIPEGSDINAVRDASLLYDYLKVYFVLWILTSTPEVMNFFFPQSVLVAQIYFVLIFLNLYYFFILVDFGLTLIFRYLSKSSENITNDLSDT